MLAGGDHEEVLASLMENRDSLYSEIADLVVDTDGQRVQAVAEEIRRSL